MTTTAPHGIDANLEKVDILRKRFPISYREAYQVLEENQGNVVKALIELEDTHRCGGHTGTMQGMAEAGETLMQNGRQMLDKMEERMSVMGQDLVAKIQEIVRSGQTSKIRVVKDGQTVMTIPTAVGAVGALIFPYAAVLATVAAMSARYELVLDKRGRVHMQNQNDQNDGNHTTAANSSVSGVTNVHEEEKTAACVTANADHYDADRN